MCYVQLALLCMQFIYRKLCSLQLRLKFEENNVWISFDLRLLLFSKKYMLKVFAKPIAEVWSNMIHQREQSWGQFLFINSKFHSNSFSSIPESIPIPLVSRKVTSNLIPIPKKSIPYQFHPRMKVVILIEHLYNNLI